MTTNQATTTVSNGNQSFPLMVCAKHFQLQRSASGSGVGLNTSCSLAISGIKTSPPACIELEHGEAADASLNKQRSTTSTPASKAYPACPSSRGSFNIQLISPERTSPCCKPHRDLAGIDRCHKLLRQLKRHSLQGTRRFKGHRPTAAGIWNLEVPYRMRIQAFLLEPPKRISLI